MSAAALKNEALVVPLSRARSAAQDVLIVDCHDSFVYNLVQLVRECGAVPHLVSCDEVEVESVDRYDRVLLSPGPGLPCEAGRLLDIVRRASGRVPVLGVCLGLQAMAEVFGGRLRQLAEVYHGIASACRVTADDELFSGLENPFVVGVIIRGWSIAPVCPLVWKSPRSRPTAKSWLCVIARWMCAACSFILRAS